MSSFPAYELRIQGVRFGDGVMLVDLDDGRTAVVRYEDFPRLRDATDEQRKSWELIGRGVGIHWPAIDEDISAEGFVRNAMGLTSDDDLPRFAPRVELLQGSGVLLVIADTLRADALGAYGAADHNGQPPTPRIDGFCDDALLFNDVSAQASWTKPAVASIMTSRHVAGHDTMSKNAVLPESLPTLASELQKAGVKTAAVVTNYNLEKGYGFARGFDAFRFLAAARYLGAPKRANRLAAYNVYRLLRERSFREGRSPSYFYRDGAIANAVAFELLADIAKNPDDRFFLWLHYMEPHDPYFAKDGASYARVSDPYPPEDWAVPMHDAYRDEVARLDLYFGNLLDGLGARGLLDRTTVVFMSDHGEEFHEHGGYYHGVTLYEEQLNVPLIIGGPQIPPGTDTRLARQIDVVPTILARLGVETPASWEGRDLLGSQPTPLFTIASENHEGHVLRSIRLADAKAPLKLILANADNPRGLAETELYDLIADLAEQSPLPDRQKLIDDLTILLSDAQNKAREGGATAGTLEPDADAKAALEALGYVGQ